MNLMDRIKMITTLTPSEEILRQYIVGHGREVIDLDEQELKETIYISSSTIYRFCRKLDLRSYDELRLGLAREYIRNEKESDVNYDFPFSKDTPLSKVSRNIMTIYTESVEWTQNALDKSQLNRAINYVSRAENIVFFASNMNTETANRFKAQMKELGKDVRISSSPYNWKLEAVNMTKKDVLLINSYAGRSSSQFGQILPELKKRGVPIIMITSTHCKSLLPYASSILLICDKESCSDKLYSFSSNISSQYILDMLYIGLYQQNFDANYEKHKYIYS